MSDDALFSTELDAVIFMQARYPNYINFSAKVRGDLPSIYGLYEALYEALGAPCQRHKTMNGHLVTPLSATWIWTSSGVALHDTETLTFARLLFAPDDFDEIFSADP